MAEKQEQRVFKVGGNLSDGTAFKAGQKVPDNIDPKDLKELEKMDAIEVKNG